VALDLSVLVEPVSHELVDCEEVLDVAIEAVSLEILLSRQAKPKVQVLRDGGYALGLQLVQNENHRVPGRVPPVRMNPHE
jgi:hypothetical protein